MCPGCQRHLKVQAVTGRPRVPTFSPLRVEGSIQHPRTAGVWEYCAVLVVRDDRGQEISRQVVGVGALGPGDSRRFTLSVDVFAPQS